MVELESLYANLYDGSNCSLDSTTSMFLDFSRGFPALMDDLKKICEGKIGYTECFSVLGTFPKNKGNCEEELLADYRPTNGQQTANRFCPKYRPTVG